MGPCDSASMSPSTQPAAALAEEFGVRKAGVGGLKGHRSNRERGRSGDQTIALSLRLQQRWEQSGNRCFSQGPQGKPKCGPDGSWGKEAIMAGGRSWNALRPGIGI